MKVGCRSQVIKISLGYTEIQSHHQYVLECKYTGCPSKAQYTKETIYGECNCIFEGREGRARTDFTTVPNGYEGLVVTWQKRP